MIFKKLKALNSSNKNNNENNNEEYKLSKILLNIILPYLEEVSNIGIKAKINSFLPRIDLDKFIIARIRSELFGGKNIEFGKKLGGFNIRYGVKEIDIKFIGIIGLVIKNLIITDSQIISCVDDIFEQINNRYVKDTSYIESKVKEICEELSNKIIYKDKTLYDFLLEILEGTHIRQDEEVPAWVKSIIESFGESKLTEDILYFLIEGISKMISELTKGVYFNLKLTFDSWFLRFVLKKKTNNGQLSELMEVFGVSIDNIKDLIINDYMSPSFTKGMGSLAKDLAISLLYDIAQYDTPNNKVSKLIEPVCISKPFQVTMTLGKDSISSRSFRWYCAEGVTLGCIRISKDKNFLNYRDVDASREKKVKLKTTFHWGISSNYDTYTVSRFSCEVSNLKKGIKYWYKVGSKEMDIWSEVGEIYIPSNEKSFTFINLLDSQGLVREDYDIFCKVAEESIKNIDNVSFIAHLGDFVNDGNNEDYWDWVLNNKCFRDNAILPVTGNHETRVNSLVQSSNIDNAIISHFSVCNMPKQDLSVGCYYSFEYMNTTFIVLNTGDFDKYGYLSDKQFDWAIEVAKKAKTKWKIMLSHKSPYSNGPHHNDYDVKAMSSQIKELASKCDIDLLIAGHDHVYSRTPIMRYSCKTNYEEKEIIHKKIKYKTAINPLGTLFVVPGTSGVKNYKQDLSIIYPSELLLQLDLPVYSSVEVTENHIFFTAYVYDTENNKSNIIDTYAIEKIEDIDNKVNEIKKEIDSLPDCYLYQEEDKVENIDFSYNKLTYKEKIKIKNYGKLIEAKKAIDSINKISSGRIAIVRTKTQFNKAIQDKNISTIVTDCQKINFSNCLGGYSRYNIDRNICIRGNSRLINVVFNIKNGSTLIIDDNVMIDNTRQIGSLFSAINCINIFDNSILILNGYSSLRTEYGLGYNGVCVLITGDFSRAYFNSKGEIYGGKGSVVCLNSNSKVIINNGKFSSNKNYYAIRSNGNIEINDGKIKSICLYKNSNTYMHGGTIGSNRGIDRIPCDIDGNVYITGGSLINGDRLIIQGRQNSNINISPDHINAIEIGNIYPFIEDEDNLIENRKQEKICINYRPRTLRELSEEEGNRYGRYTYIKIGYKELDKGLERFINCIPEGKVYIYSKL